MQKYIFLPVAHKIFMFGKAATQQNDQWKSFAAVPVFDSQGLDSVRRLCYNKSKLFHGRSVLMNTTKIEKSGAQLIAHRGVSGLELENTCAAFVAAGNRSYFGIETDVHMTADGKFIIIHDDVTGRVAMEDISVEGSDFAALRALEMKRKDGTTRWDLRLPSLEEYLDVCRSYGKKAVLELKNTFETEDARRVVDICREHYGLENMIFISFFFKNMVSVKEYAPEANAQYLIGGETDLLVRTDLVDRMCALGVDVDIYHRLLTPEHVAYLHERGLKVNCWTVDDAARAEELISWGVDFITTNILE